MTEDKSLADAVFKEHDRDAIPAMQQGLELRCEIENLKLQVRALRRPTHPAAPGEQPAPPTAHVAQAPEQAALASLAALRPEARLDELQEHAMALHRQIERQDERLGEQALVLALQCERIRRLEEALEAQRAAAIVPAPER